MTINKSLVRKLASIIERAILVDMRSLFLWRIFLEKDFIKFQLIVISIVQSINAECFLYGNVQSYNKDTFKKRYRKYFILHNDYQPLKPKNSLSSYNS